MSVKFPSKLLSPKSIGVQQIFITTRRRFNDLLSSVHAGGLTTRAHVLDEHFNPYIYKTLSSFMSFTTRCGVITQ